MALVHAYLTAYNSAQAAAWAYVLFASCRALAAASKPAPEAVYAATHAAVSLFQTASLLETLHALCGLTRSGVAGNVAQWAGARAPLEQTACALR
jgi:hypothetical protein